MYLNIIFFITLIALVLFFYYSKDYKEAFFDFPDESHTSFVADSKDKFNTITNTINLTDPAIPLNSNTDIAIKLALGGINAKPTSNAYHLQSKNDYTLPQNIPNTFQNAQSCEAKGPDCSAFDDSTFAANCGMSFDPKGISSSGKPHIGGKYISPEDRQKQMNNAQAVLDNAIAPYDPYKVYQPTLGKSKPGTFALTKDQCIVVKEKVDCASKQTFSSPNCTQCYTSQNFARVGPDTQRLPSTLNLFGSGLLYVIPNGGTCHTWSADEQAKINAGADQSSVCNATPGQAFQGSSGSLPQCGGCYCCENVPITFVNGTTLDPNNPTSVTIAANAEGTGFVIIVQPDPKSNGTLPYVTGYIQGQTPRGPFKLDLINLVQNDQVSRSKPKINGSVSVNGFTCLVIIPGTKQTYMNLSCLMPFSFLNMYDGDALTCDNGPIITQAASATFLESDPCFGKANKPGNYKLACLQERWIEMGGTQQGTGYPANQGSADAIQKDANGNPIDIDTIVNNLSGKMTSASTGQDTTGNNLSLSDWNTVSMWATNTPINTPCDGPNSTSGPLSKECLSYLYTNQGVKSHIGGTYTLSPSSVASMLGQTTPNTFCQPGTSIDPATPAGFKFAQSLGGINAVKQSYDQINRLANDNTQTNDARRTAVNQCYGVNIDQMAAQKTTGPTQVFAVGPGYNYTQAQAQQICTKYGAVTATMAQVNDAQAKGANWCFGAMVADDTQNGYYPMQSAITGCGNSIGVQQFGLVWAPSTDGSTAHETGKGNPATAMLGVNCYGPKPGIDNYPAGTILPFNQTEWDKPSV